MNTTRLLVSLCLLVCLGGGAAFNTTADENDWLRVQQRLGDLGFNPGPVDGVLGKRTQQAIQEYQRSVKLAPTGELDQATREKLFPDLTLYTQVFDPFHYPNPVTGELDGPAVDLIRKACRDAELNCTLKLGAGTWKQTQDLVKDGRGDGLFLIGWNAARAEYLVRTDQILTTEYGFFVRGDDNLEFAGAEALDGYTVGVYGPSNTSRTLDKLILAMRNKGVRINKEQLKDGEAVLRKLNTSRGKYAVFSNRDVGFSLSNRLGLGNIRYLGRYKPVAYYIGLLKKHGEGEIVSRFDSAFRALVESGLKCEILAPYDLSSKQYDCSEESSTRPPEASSPSPPVRTSEQGKCVRETIADAEVVRCGSTCLKWQRRGSNEPMSWADARDQYISELNNSGFAGERTWRLPTVQELKTLWRDQISSENRLYLDPAFDPTQTECWSADRDDQSGRDDALYVDFFDRGVLTKSIRDSNYVRAVSGKYCGP